MINQKNFSFRSKLIMVLLLLGFISATILASAVYYSGKNGLTENVSKHLRSVRASKQYQIEQYFNHTSGVVEMLSSNPTIIEAMKDFKSGFASLESNKTSNYSTGLTNYYDWFLDSLLTNMDVKKEIGFYYPKSNLSQYLQYHYIINNPHPQGSKNKLPFARDGSLYSSIHQEHHSYLNKIIEEFGFYDIFLVDLEIGNIVYSAYKETDFSTNLYEGP